MEWTAVMVGDERVRFRGVAVVDGNDHVHIARPGTLGVEPRRLCGMVGMAVVVADDVHPRGVRLALDADVVARIDLVAVTCPLDDDVARPPGLGDFAVATRPDHYAANLVRVALSRVRANRFHRITRNFHAEKTKSVGRPRRDRRGWPS